MSSVIGYWEVWHLVLAFVLYFWIYFERFPVRALNWRPDQQRTFLTVVAIAFLWEVSEYFWNLGAYADFKHYFTNSMKDMGAAMIVAFVASVISRPK